MRACALVEYERRKATELVAVSARKEPRQPRRWPALARSARGDSLDRVDGLVEAAVEADVGVVAGAAGELADNAAEVGSLTPGRGRCTAFETVTLLSFQPKSFCQAPREASDGDDEARFLRSSQSRPRHWCLRRCRQADRRSRCCRPGAGTHLAGVASRPSP